MSNSTRKISRAQHDQLTVRTAQLVSRHEVLLQALDRYITGLETALISKGILTREELEGIAEAATAQPEVATPAEPAKVTLA